MLNDTARDSTLAGVGSGNDLALIRSHIYACISAMRDEDGRVKSRELSLAVTKLQEAAMWIDEHLRRV